MTALAGFPQSFSSRDDGGVQMRCHQRIYPISVIAAATYALLDRGYFVIDRDESGDHLISIYPKEGGDLRNVAGSLANELLASSCRMHLHQRKEVILESVTLAAMAGSLGRPDLDDLDDFDFSEGGLEDPLGIATSWEDKYAKPKGDS
jgi:His-Xaa-Ser system protein HxsD